MTEAPRSGPRDPPGARPEAVPEPAYEPPAILWEEDIAVESNLQGACAKFAPMGGTCTAASKS